MEICSQTGLMIASRLRQATSQQMQGTDLRSAEVRTILSLTLATKLAQKQQFVERGRLYHH